MKQMMINEQRSKESAASGMPSADGTGDGGPGGKSSFSSALYAATLPELEEVVRELESEGLIKYIITTQTVIVRSSATQK